jgi:hypothetical protein
MAGIHRKVWQNTPAWRDAFRNFCRKMAIRDAARTVWLPALAMGIRTETDHQVLQVMMRWPLPDSLPPGTAPWRATVMSAWNIVPGRVRYRERTDILGMPVRLDRLEESRDGDHTSHPPDLTGMLLNCYSRNGMKRKAANGQPAGQESVQSGSGFDPGFRIELRQETCNLSRGRNGAYAKRTM